MPLDMNMDLAILGFEELGQLASKQDVSDWNNMSRVQLVEALHSQGIGTNPLPCQGTGCMIEVIDVLKSSVSNLTATFSDFVQELKDLRAQSKEDIAILKNEIAIIRREIAAGPSFAYY